MKQMPWNIGPIPAILWGEPAKQLFLYIHGQGGCKEEAEAFAALAGDFGWQVLSIDLPEHGARTEETDAFDPWHVVPELQAVLTSVRTRWEKISLYANSIGAWFSLLAMKDQPLERCLFVSPVLDMERLIETMMTWAGVTKERLERERVIPTNFGQTLSWDYLQYVRSHPVTTWDGQTGILYAGGDNLTERRVVDAFVQRFHCQLTVMEDGEHWFHTPEQLAVLRRWTLEQLTR